MKCCFAALIPSFLLLFTTASTFAEDFRIGSWNIEWLGFPDKRGSPGRDVEQLPSDLASYIADAKLDVLALEEIGVDKNEVPWTSKQLDIVIDELRLKHDQLWQYQLFAKAEYPPGTEDFITRGQHIGIAWRTGRAKLVGEPFSVPVGENPIYGNKFWERRATAVKLSFGEGKTDVVFVPVHLKSNRNDANPSDTQFTQKQRMAEMTAFTAQLKTLKNHFKDKDVMLLGDTNILGPENDTPKQLVDAGFIDLNEGDEGTTAAWGKGYSSAPFDRIFVSANQKEFAGSVQRIHRTKNGTDEEIKNYKKRFSDHYLVSCVIQVSDDDD